MHNLKVENGVLFSGMKTKDLSPGHSVLGSSEGLLRTDESFATEKVQVVETSKDSC